MLKWPLRDQDAAVEHGLPLADQAIRDPAAGERAMYTIDVYRP